MTMITPSYLGETIEYSSLHACRSTLEDPTGVSLAVPAAYSAHLETGTVNGHISLDFPVTVHGEINRSLSVDLGSGGPTVRAMTTNGGVSIHRKDT